MSVDHAEDLQKMVDRISMEDGIVPTFPLLSDPGHRVIDRYGLFNADESKGRPVPHPTAIVINKAGVVQWKFTEVNYKIRPTNEDILGALSRIR